MFGKLLAATILFCSVAYGAPSSAMVGTVTIRGNMSIDGNQVTGDATLFDGSTVETASASAVLRMNDHTIIEMAAGTRGIVHADYIRLEQGSIDIRPICGFVVEHNDVRVTPNSPNAHGVISTNSSNAGVSSRSGEFLVLDNQGRILNRVRSGGSSSLSAGQAQSAAAATFVGSLDIVDRHHLLTPFAPDTNITYELQGKNVDKIQGKLVEVAGTIDPKRSSVLAQVEGVISTTKETGMCVEKAVPYPWILGGAAAAAAVAGIAVTNQPSSPASK